MENKDKVYIERQKNYTKRRGSYGPTGSISANGCGAIAVYNVLVHFGIPMDFMTIVRRFHQQWPVSTSFGGCMGTLITHIIWELKQYNLRVYPIIFTRKTIKQIHLNENSAMVFLYFWKKKRRLGGHYQAVFGNPDGTITLHNPKETYFGLKDLLREKRKKESMWFCMGLIVRKRRK